MIVLNCSSTIDVKCSICGKKTDSYIEYAHADGVGIKMPICNACTETSSKNFHDSIKKSMDLRLKQIKCDIKIEKEISFNE